jgi:hypothetical protein
MNHQIFGNFFFKTPLSLNNITNNIVYQHRKIWAFLQDQNHSTLLLTYCLFHTVLWKKAVMFSSGLLKWNNLKILENNYQDHSPAQITDNLTIIQAFLKKQKPGQKNLSINSEPIISQHYRIRMHKY